MNIDLEDVPIRRKPVEATFEASEMDLDADDAALDGSVSFTGETERVDEQVHLRGTVTTDAEIVCFRCLEPVSKRLEISFDDIFVDEAHEPTEAELALEVEDLDVSIAIGGKIDIAEVVREQLLLALTDQVLCRDDCQGLCPKCGGNRNLLDCKCIDEEVDPRWAALKGLK